LPLPAYTAYPPGIEIGRYCDETARYLVRNVLSNRESEAEKKIKKILAKEKRISTRELSRKARMNSEQLERILTALIRLDLVGRETESGISGQPRHIIVWLG